MDSWGIFCMYIQGTTGLHRKQRRIVQGWCTNVAVVNINNPGIIVVCIPQAVVVQLLGIVQQLHAIIQDTPLYKRDISSILSVAQVTGFQTTTLKVHVWHQVGVQRQKQRWVRKIGNLEMGYNDKQLRCQKRYVALGPHGPKCQHTAGLTLLPDSHQLLSPSYQGLLQPPLVVVFVLQGEVRVTIEPTKEHCFKYCDGLTHSPVNILTAGDMCMSRNIHLWTCYQIAVSIVACLLLLLTEVLA